MATRIAIIITARPSYSRVKTVISALVARGADVQLLVCASALLERYGAVVTLIRQDFPHIPLMEVWTTYEGATLETSAKETSALTSELAGILARLRPDQGLVIADRHEVLGAAQALAYQHIRFSHLQGGELSGSIDDRVRKSITQLADVHLVSTHLAQLRVYGLTGSSHVYVTGCPSVDLALEALHDQPMTFDELGGVGADLDLAQPFAVILQHSVTDEAVDAGNQLETTLAASAATGLPLLVIWPGQDAGAETASKAIRVWLPTAQAHAVRNVSPTRFLRLLTQASVLIGNSSVGIRECSFLGTPVVNIGTRQRWRERGPNVVDVDYQYQDIVRAIRQQVAHGPYASSTLYGRGDAGERCAEVLCQSFPERRS